LCLLFCKRSPRFIRDSPVNVGETELCKCNQNGLCLFAACGQSVCDMASFGLLALFNQPVLDEVLDPLGQQGGRNPHKTLSQLDVPACRVNEEISQDEKCPTVSHEIQ